MALVSYRALDASSGWRRCVVQDEALGYAARGWAVLPLHGMRGDRCTCGSASCSSPAKHPLTRHGLRDASSDADQVRSWWQEQPTANVGIRTGEASGIVVIDIDGTEGEDAAFELCREHGWFLDTCRARTGRPGGWHLFYRHPGRVIRNRRLGPGLDVRGDGGYVVAAPSLHASGRRYWFVWPPEVLEPQPLPGWMLERLADDQTLATPSTPAPLLPRGSRDRHRHYAAAAVQGEAEAVRVATPGARNQTLNAAAFKVGTLIGAGLLEPESAAGVLLAAALEAGLPEREARKTILSGFRAGIAQPRQVSP